MSSLNVLLRCRSDGRRPRATDFDRLSMFQTEVVTGRDRVRVLVVGGANLLQGYVLFLQGLVGRCRGINGLGSTVTPYWAISLRDVREEVLVLSL